MHTLNYECFELQNCIFPRSVLKALLQRLAFPGLCTNQSRNNWNSLHVEITYIDFTFSARWLILGLKTNLLNDRMHPLLMRQFKLCGIGFWFASWWGVGLCSWNASNGWLKSFATKLHLSRAGAVWSNDALLGKLCKNRVRNASNKSGLLPFSAVE